MSDANRTIESFQMASDQREGDEDYSQVVPDKYIELIVNRFRSADLHEHQSIGGSLKSTKADDIQFEEGKFSSVDLSDSRWSKLSLCQMRFQNCDLANAHWTRGDFEATEFDKCRGTGLQLTDSSCRNSLFVRSKLKLAAFHGSKFHCVRFENCDLSEANFDGAELTDVVFRDCDLRTSRFPGSKMRNVDLRGSQLAGMQIDPPSLHGATIDTIQLLDLAAVFGLIVEPLEDDAR